MSVFNEPEDWLNEAITSMLNQSYSNFEFIIILDNPNNTKARASLKKYKKIDERIVLYINSENLGLATSLNYGILKSKGSYIARMDADDISEINRLEDQLKYILENDADLVASNINFIGERSGLYQKNRIDKNELLKILNYEDVLPHPTWLAKKSLYIELGCYKDIGPAQDYEFIARCIQNKKIIRLMEKPLLLYRVSGKNISHRQRMRQLKNKLIIMNMISNGLAFEDAGNKLIELSYLQSKYVYRLTGNKFLRLFCLLRLGYFLMRLLSKLSNSR